MQDRTISFPKQTGEYYYFNPEEGKICLTRNWDRAMLLNESLAYWKRDQYGDDRDNEDYSGDEYQEHLPEQE